MREAIAFHLDGLREEGQAVPEPHTYSAYVELPAWPQKRPDETSHSCGDPPFVVLPCSDKNSFLRMRNLRSWEPKFDAASAKAVFIGEVLEVRVGTKAELEEHSNFYVVQMRVEGYSKGIKSGELTSSPRERRGFLQALYARAYDALGGFLTRRPCIRRRLRTG
jgi:hypothetical protein